jgi:hypothetical protein
MQKYNSYSKWNNIVTEKKVYFQKKLFTVRRYLGYMVVITYNKQDTLVTIKYFEQLILINCNIIPSQIS